MFEVFFRLAREADDEVCRERQARARSFEGVRPGHVVFCGVAAGHAAQDSVGTRLHGQVHVQGQHLQLRMRSHQLRGDVSRMRRGVAKSQELGHLASDPPEEPGKLRCGGRRLRFEFRRIGRHAGFVPRVHGLPEEGDLPNTARDQVGDLPDDLICGPVALRSAGIRNDTKCASLIAALHDRHVCGHLPAIGMGLRPQELRVVHVEHGAGHWRAPLLDFADQRGKLGDVVRSEDDVDERRLSEELFAFLLRNTARNGKNLPSLGLLERPEGPEKAHQLVFGLLPDAACVDDEQIGERRLIREPIPALQEDLLDSTGIVDVHLTAEGLDEVLLHGLAAIALAGAGHSRQTAEITSFAGGHRARRATSPM